jgi:3-deoxy-D-manno-octulosonic-acid transferase
MEKTLTFWVYSLLIYLGNGYISFGSLGSKKLKLLKSGRASTWQILSTRSLTTGKRIWMHCASLGEFEQGRPLIEKFKEEHPDTTIFLSFFSPSGYEIQKNYDKADVIFYLPSDTNANAEKLLQLIRPDMVIFIKYEFWWNLTRYLIKCKIPVFLISSVFRPNDYFWHPFVQPFKQILKEYTHICTQDDISAQVLSIQGFDNYSIAGDTRIDRVIQRSKIPGNADAIKEYINGNPVIVYGSVWMSDMHVVSATVSAFPDYIHIIAPHDISEKNIHQIRSQLHPSSDLYSANDWKANVIIIDNIGMLAGLYAFAKYVYVGGGFQKGIHNILEPAVYKIPVFFGPNHQKFNEAVTLTTMNAAIPVENFDPMIEKIKRLDLHPVEYQGIADRLDQYFNKNKGATEKTYNMINSLRPVQ